jgi:hypothetical protein
MSFAFVVGKVNEQPASEQPMVGAFPDQGWVSLDTASPAAGGQQLGASMWPALQPCRPARRRQAGGVAIAPELLMVDSGR